MLIKLLIALTLVYVFIKLSRRKKDFTATVKRFNENPRHDNTLIICPQCTTFFHETLGVSQSGRVYCSGACAQKQK